MKVQFVKRLKGIIALAVASLMFLQTGLPATALEEGNDYQYNCIYMGDMEISGSQLLYNGEKYGFLFFGDSGGTSISLSDSSAHDWYRKDCLPVDYGYTKVIEGGTNLETSFYIALTSAAESGSKYAKFVVAAGDLVADASVIATQSGTMLTDTLFSVSQQGATYQLVAPLGESGHKYVWGNYGGETVTMNDVDAEFLTAQSGSGTQTDPYVFGIELTEVYRLVDNFSHDGAICNKDASGDIYIIPDTLVNVGHGSYASGAVLGHYEIQKYETPADVEAHYNDTDYFTTLSYDDINYTLKNNGSKASFVMPKGHLVFNTITHEEILAEPKRVAKYKVSAKAATCTESGNVEYVQCPSCEARFVMEEGAWVEKTKAEVTIPATNHAGKTKVAAKAATCTATGNIEYYECGDCNVLFADAAAKKPISLAETVVAKKNHDYQVKTVAATVKADGENYKECRVCKAVAERTVIAKPLVTLSKDILTYTGKTAKPKVIVKGSDGKPIASSNYTVSYSNKSSKKLGNYSVTIKFKGEQYNGKIAKIYSISPANVALKKITSDKSSISVSWSKGKSNVSGYEISCSTDKNFATKKTKTVTVKEMETTTAIIQKLNKKTTYYVRIRTYSTVGKTKVYSGWTKAKLIKTKTK